MQVYKSIVKNSQGIYQPFYHRVASQISPRAGRTTPTVGNIAPEKW